MIRDEIVMLRRSRILDQGWTSISPPARCLYLTMAAMCSPGSEDVSTTLDVLSRRSGIGVRSVSRALRELRDADMIYKSGKCAYCVEGGDLM